MAKLANALQREYVGDFKEDSKEETPEIAEMKRKVELINKGFVVYIANVGKFVEGDNYTTLKITLLSEVNRMPVFGDIELKITRQALPQLKIELAKVG